MSWERHILGELIYIKKGKSITKKDSNAGPYPVVLGGREPAYYIDQFNHTGKAIVVSRSGASAGFISHWNEPIFVTDGFLIQPKENINHDFLYYLMKSHESELQGLQGGSAIPHVTPNIINNIIVYIPNIYIQENIANILSTYDDLIENNNRQIKLLEEAAQRLYKEWFVDLHFPGYENCRSVDGVPEGWHRGKLQELIDVNYGKDHKKAPDKGDIPVYGSGGLMRKCNRSLYSGESVLIPRKGSLNNIMYVNEAFWTVDTMFYTTMKMENIALYVYFYLKRYDMYSMNIGAAVPSMTVKILDAMDVLIPDKGTLGVFYDYIGPNYQQISIITHENERLTEARDRLLPKLMSGEIEV